MVTNNIIPLYFKTRAQKHIFFPLKECALVTKVLAHEKTYAAMENKKVYYGNFQLGIYLSAYTPLHC